MPHRLIPVLILACLSTAFLGCSRDRTVFYSSRDKPTTVSLVDTIERTTLWSYDIPVDQKLTVDLNADTQDTGPGGYPTEMTYTVTSYNNTMTIHHVGDGSDTTYDSGTVELPGVPVILLVDYRPAPENPPAQVDVMIDDQDTEPLPVPDLEEAIESDTAALEAEGVEVDVEPGDSEVDVVEPEVEEAEEPQAQGNDSLLDEFVSQNPAE